MIGDGTRLVHLYYEKFLTTPGDLDVADQILATDVVFHNPISPDGIHGIDQYKQFALRWYRGFPDRRFKVEDTVEEGSKVAALFTITGTHNGEFAGAAPTGHHIQVHGMNIFRIEKGKIKDVKAFFNPLELYQPIGVKL
ncbi:MAG TPA: ester cyclase [Candidatus Dormibacteraeota bacterium]|jgi:steroid delta-isomerase-like uncharacterized protein